MIVETDLGLEVCTVCSALYHTQHSCNCSWSGALEPLPARTFVAKLEADDAFDRIDDQMFFTPRASRYVFGSGTTFVLSS